MTFDLNTLWFVLIAILFTGFFVLEGFDFASACCCRSSARPTRSVAGSSTRSVLLDGNEVWF